MFSIPLLPGLEMYLGERESYFLSAMPGLSSMLCCVAWSWQSTSSSIRLDMQNWSQTHNSTHLMCKDTNAWKKTRIYPEGAQRSRSKIERIHIQKPDSGTHCLTRIQVTVSEGIGGQATGLPIVWQGCKLVYQRALEARLLAMATCSTPQCSCWQCFNTHLLWKDASILEV
jgi:hypothetical protein